MKEDEIEALFSVSMPERERAAFSVAIYGGLRAGELWGLRWRDVHLGDKAPKIVVRYSYDGPTKSGKIREVPLLRPALRALQKWQRVCCARSGLVWSPGGNATHTRSYDMQWDRWKQKAGIKRHIRFHDLRHTCASHLIQGTWGSALRLEEVQMWLGHSSRVTTERYAHLCPENLHDVAKGMF